MPRFVIHVRPTVADQQARAALATRYPEIDLVTIRGRPDGGEDWVCDAPSLTHLERWVTEQRIWVDLGSRWAERTTTEPGPR